MNIYQPTLIKLKAKVMKFLFVCFSDEENNSQESSNPVSTESPKATVSNTDSETTDNIWAGPAKIVEEKSQDEEFDEYFEDMFL